MLDNVDMGIFDYLPDGDFPVLVLGITISKSFPRDFKGKPEKEWKHIAHQTGGHSCHQKYVFGTIVDVPTDIEQKMADLHGVYYDSQISQYCTLGHLKHYERMLSAIFDDKASCDWSYYNFEEGFYPIDYSRDTLAALATPEYMATMPDDLDDLLIWESDLDKFCGCLGRWGLYILGENSD